MKKLFTPQWLCAVVIVLLSWLAILRPQAASGHEGHTGTLAAGSSTNCNAVTNLQPFLDLLPIPPRAMPARTNFNYCVPVATNLCFPNGIPEYDMPMTSFRHYFHTNLPAVEVWGYAGYYPGPTFDVVTNAPILVNWMNQLPTFYPSWLPADTNLHGVPDTSVRTVVHLHGGTTLPRYDGFPTNWYRTGQSDQYFYGNIDFGNEGETLWYHDHAIGVTANNVYAGLAGFYFLRNPAFDTNLNLPSGKYEIPLLIQDRDIQTNCSPPSLMLGNLPWHNLVVVNGKVTPYLPVEPRRYRFRILNGAVFRTFGLSLSITDTNGVALSSSLTPPSFYVIGTEDGYLQKTATVAPSTNNPNIPANPGITLMPGERVDLIIDFTSYTNRNITMLNVDHNADPTNLLHDTTAPYDTNIMQFRVTLPLESIDTSSIPTNTIMTNWVTTAAMLTQAVTNRQITLDLANENPFPGPPFVQGGNPFALLNLSFFDEPVTEMPHAGDTEIWSFINLSDEAHPIHVHLLDFRVVDRTRFGGWNTNSNTAFPPTNAVAYLTDRTNGRLKDLSSYLSTNASDIQAVKQFESGPKDVVRVAPFAVTRIVMKWPTDPLYYTTPSAVSLDTNTFGRYIYHCHILDHEDNDMMRPLQIKPPHMPTLHSVLDPTVNLAGNNHFKLGIDTRPGDIYRIESSTDLSPSGWLELPVADVAGSGARVHIVPPSSTDRIRFYRVKRLISP